MNDIRVAWKGNLREISTKIGRFRRGIFRTVTRKDALFLMATYPGFEMKGMEGTHLELIAREGGFIAIIRSRGLGDVVACAYFLAYPLFHAHPDTKVDFYCDLGYKELIDQLPFLHQVFGDPKSLNHTRYDTYADLCWVPEREDPKNVKVRPEIFARPAGSLANFQFDYLTFSKEIEALGLRILTVKNRDWKKPLVGIQMTSASPVRVYPIEYTAKLVELLTNCGFEVLLLGGDHWRYGLAQWNGNNILNLVDQTTLIQCASLVSHCDFFIAPDSGLLHLASVLGIPTLGLFGNIKPVNRIKYYPVTEAMYPEGEFDCIPCGDVHNPCPVCSNLAGTHKSGRCMYLLTPERVMDYFLDFVERFSDLSYKKEKSEDPLCPFCDSEGQEINAIQGKWFKEFYPNKVRYYKCNTCLSIFSDPDLDPVDYGEGYWTDGPGKFAGDYFLPQKEQYHISIARKVQNLFRERVT